MASKATRAIPLLRKSFQGVLRDFWVGMSQHQWVSIILEYIITGNNRPPSATMLPPMPPALPAKAMYGSVLDTGYNYWDWNELGSKIENVLQLSKGP